MEIILILLINDKLMNYIRNKSPAARLRVAGILLFIRFCQCCPSADPAAPYPPFPRLVFLCILLSSSETRAGLHQYPLCFRECL